MTECESIVDIAAAYARGDASPREIVARTLARIEDLNPRVLAFLDVAREHAEAAARDAETEFRENGPRGPLHGVPFALKDIIDREGFRTTAQSRLLADNVARRSADCVRRLEAAGAIYVGKLATHEFAIGGPAFDLPAPPARNPWNTDHFTGGSSSGSGAAVAARMVPLALGTDTGGSVRNPAAMCGIVGMKPTRDLVSRDGVIPLSTSLDTVGPLTATVADNALCLDAIATWTPDDGKGYGAAPNNGLAGLRIGVIRRFYRDDMKAAPEMTAAIEQALDVLADMGARVVEIDTAAHADFAACNRVILTAEAYAFHRENLAARYWEYSASSRERILPGAFVSAADYVDALRIRRKLSEAFNRTLAAVDVAVTATNMDPPARLDDPDTLRAQYGRHARAPFNVTGNPALSIPIGLSSEGLPLAMQIVGKYFDERTMYRVASAYQRAVPEAFRPPPLVRD